MSKKTLTGKIINIKNEKIATVLVERLKSHSKYHKQFTISKKYLVHNPNNEHKLNEYVKITESKPLSKKIHFSIDKQSKDKK